VLLSFAADAHDCIVVGLLRAQPNTFTAKEIVGAAPRDLQTVSYGTQWCQSLSSLFSRTWPDEFECGVAAQEKGTLKPQPLLVSTLG
jgi:hypothetical protein